MEHPFLEDKHILAYCKISGESNRVSHRHTTENNPKTNYPSSSGGIPSPSGDDGPKKISGQQKRHFNPSEKEIPDAATLRDQWRYAIRQYSKWYSHAWGTAILAGTAFFSLGWIIKGENPIPSFNSNKDTDIDNSHHP